MTILHVYVSDQYGSPVDNATVTLTAYAFSPYTTKTNSEGLTTAQLPDMNGVVQIRVKKTGYTPTSTGIAVHEGETVTANVVLNFIEEEPPDPEPEPEPEPKASLVFHVIDEDSNPIGSASITIYSGTRLTNAQGTAVFPYAVTGQAIEYFIRKRGYEAIHDTLTIGYGAVVYEVTKVMISIPEPPPEPVEPFKIPRPSSFMPDWTLKDWAIVVGSVGAYILIKDEEEKK